MRTLPASSLVLSIFLAACYGLSEPPPPDDHVTAGKALASALGCSGCHGADLSGAVGPNLTPDVATGLGAWTDGQIAAAIRDGVDDEGSSLCASMPRFAALDDEQTASLVAFLRTLPPTTHDVAGTGACDPPDVPSDAGLDDAGVVIVSDDGDAGTVTGGCAGFADPSTPAACHACKVSPCQANGCFGGYYCDLTLSRCVPKPAGC